MKLSIGKIFKAVAPVVGAFAGGPIGAAVGSAASGQGLKKVGSGMIGAGKTAAALLPLALGGGVPTLGGMSALGGGAGAAGAAGAADAAGGGGGGGGWFGGLKKLGSGLLNNIDPILAGGALISSQDAQRKADRYRQKALGFAEQQYNERAPLRTLGMRGLTNEQPIDLNPELQNTANPFSRPLRPLGVF